MTALFLNLFDLNHHKISANFLTMLFINGIFLQIKRTLFKNSSITGQGYRS